MSILIIADLHLSDDLVLFEKFITEVANKVDKLYIIGDLFDLYLGDDLITSHYQKVVYQLKNLSKKTQIFIMTGNRDFLIGKNFAINSGATLITEPYILGDFVLIHGDSLVTDDKNYQRFKKIIQHTITKFLILSLKKSWRQKLANKIKSYSNQIKNLKDKSIMDINENSLENFMQNYQKKDLIHGHTHRQKIHIYKNYKRFVLGDWSLQKGNAISIKDGEIKYLLISDPVNTDCVNPLSH